MKEGRRLSSERDGQGKRLRTVCSPIACFLFITVTILSIKILLNNCIPYLGIIPIGGFPNNSVGKESACSAGDLSSIPGSGRSPGKGIGYPLQYSWAFLVAQLVKNLPCNAGDLGSIPRLGKSPGERKGYPLQYSGLENSQRIGHS